jgi:4-amino-4-deoxy-L-arabinose transferase-like glycosyltransferase
MSGFISNRWVLLLVLAVFIICKVPHLSYPYYWDESWPYAVAIKEMYRHGVSLLPTALDPELSRGHPLFFHAIAAIWMNIFGFSRIAMHSFALYISVLFLIAIYEAGLRLFNKRVAELSLILVASQVVFFVQSSFVLFEILIAFLAFVSICFYVKDKYLLTGLCLAALFFTKESGLVLGVVLGVDAFVCLFQKNKVWKQRLLRLASVTLPCFLIVIFFLLQKHVRGWYVFPLYADNVEHNWNAFWYKFRMACIRDVFYENFKFYYYLLLAVIAIIAAIRSRSGRYLIVLLPVVIIYYFVDDMRAGRPLPSIPFFISFVIAVLYLLKVFSNPELARQTYQQKFIVLTGLFVLCFLCFSAVNFITYRYLLAAIVPMLFITAILFDILIERSFRWLYYPVLGVILVITWCAFKFDDGYGDANLGAYNAMDVQQGVVNYLEQNNCYDKNIGSSSFLEQQHLINPATGFLHSSRSFKNVKWDIDDKSDFAVFDNIEPDKRYDEMKNRPGFHLIYKIEKGKVWAEIYRISRPN